MKIPNQIKLGDFKFTFIEIDQYGLLKFAVEMGSLNYILYDVSDEGNTNEVFTNIKNDVWYDEYDEAISISFEESCFSFITIDLPVCGWDGQYDKDLKDVDILVRYTDTQTNNIATLTNLDEIENFTKWYQLLKKEE